MPVKHGQFSLSQHIFIQNLLPHIFLCQQFAAFCHFFWSQWVFWLNKYLVMFFSISQSCSFFMAIIFCSSVVPVLTFNTSGVYNFNTKKPIIPVNLVPFFNFWFLFSCFITHRVTNQLKSLFLLKSKQLRSFIENREELCCSQNASLVSMCMEDHYSYIFLKKRVIYELGSHFNEIRFI